MWLFANGRHRRAIGKREVNYYGRTWTLGGTEEKDDNNEGGPIALHDDALGELGTLELDIFSRREDILVYIQPKLLAFMFLTGFRLFYF